MFAGMPLIMTQAQGPGHIAFSRDAPGELIPVPLQPGQSIDVREHLFLVATTNVHYDWFQTNIWFTTQNGNETETHYPIGMFMDRFTAPQAPGLLLLHAAGNVFVRELGPRRNDPGQADGAGVQRSQRADAPALRTSRALILKRLGSWGIAIIWLRADRAGRVGVQSGRSSGRRAVRLRPDLRRVARQHAPNFSVRDRAGLVAKRVWRSARSQLRDETTEMAPARGGSRDRAGSSTRPIVRSAPNHRTLALSRRAALRTRSA